MDRRGELSVNKYKTWRHCKVTIWGINIKRVEVILRCLEQDDDDDDDVG
jgi:hypothetical protein